MACRTAVGICTPMPTEMGPLGLRFQRLTLEWHRARCALHLPTNFNSFDIAADNMEVGDARNHAAEFCLKHDPRPEFLFFLDYDVIPSPDAFTKLFYRAQCYPDYDIFAGVYCCKDSPAEPLIYVDQGVGAYWDWTLGDLLFNVTACHSGLTLIRTSLFERLPHSEENPWYLTKHSEVKVDERGGVSRSGGTEDLWFCKRAVTEAKAKILVDTSVLAGHINNSTGQIFGLPEDCPPVKRAHWLRDMKKKVGRGQLKKAIDLGAAESRREWPGYKTYTTDIRPDSKPDYVMDTRMLNFPDASFDLVASAHHLEHIGRWDQERVWAEMARITKPGGKWEHVLPNLQWAAGMLVDNRTDEHVFNVLYGSQEQADCKRDFNTHYFGFTPTIARELAESVGMTNVVTKSYLDDDALGYNIILTADKPQRRRRGQCNVNKRAKS